MERVLITGGAGFIGSNIAHSLVRKGYRVTVLDNLSTGSKKNISDIIKKIKFVRGDIRNYQTVRRTMHNHDFVLHQAALPSVPRSIQNPRASHDNNINGTLNVLLAARDYKIKKVVLASSSSVYGNRKAPKTGNIQTKREYMKPMPLSPYAVTKLVSEYYAKVFSHIYNLHTVCIRYFNVFGPRQNPQSEYAAVIPKFITCLLHNQRPVIFGNGKQTRDFTYIDNVVRANILAMKSPATVSGETINIACGNSYSLLDLVSQLNKIIGTAIKPVFAPERTGDVKHSLADISKAKRLLHYQPWVSFEKGLKETVMWFTK
ncbi:MAG: SDR family oxidoreductase [Parcubacteria group bacterium]